MSVVMNLTLEDVWARIGKL